MRKTKSAESFEALYIFVQFTKGGICLPTTHLFLKNENLINKKVELLDNKSLLIIPKKTLDY